ncbi:MAG: hypothetical protein LBI63_02185 [Candidatus Ancillula sp.]|nr:hypothetical protein [Candidatus Ancillula sp.]
MKEKFIAYGPIGAIVVVLLVVVFSVNFATGFGPGGKYAPGGASAVSTNSPSSSTTAPGSSASVPVTGSSVPPTGSVPDNEAGTAPAGDAPAPTTGDTPAENPAPAQPAAE